MDTNLVLPLAVDKCAVSSTITSRREQDSAKKNQQHSSQREKDAGRR